MVVNRNVGRHLPKVLCVKNCHWLKVPYTSWYFIHINDSFRILIYVNDQNPHRIKHKPIYKNVHQTTKHTATASIKLVYQNVPPNNQRPATANTNQLTMTYIVYHDTYSYHEGLLSRLNWETSKVVILL